MTEAKIIDRIRKLLRLSESPSVHEAEAAAAQAQRLMTRHRIDMAMLADAGEEPDVTKPHWNDPLASVKRIGNMAVWRMTIANALAEANGCRTIIGTDDTGFDLCLIGTSDDVALVRVAFRYLSDEVERVARHARRPRQTRADARRWLTAFRQGAADRLAERVDEAAEEAQEEARAAAAADATALVRVTDAIAQLDARLDEAIRIESDLNPEPMQSREQTLDIDPYIRGQVAADTIALDGHRTKIADE